MQSQKWSRWESYKSTLNSNNGLQQVYGAWRRQAAGAQVVNRRLTLLDEFRQRMERADEASDSDEANVTHHHLNDFSNRTQHQKNRKEAYSRMNQTHARVYDGVLLQGLPMPAVISDQGAAGNRSTRAQSVVQAPYLGEAYFKSMLMLPLHLIEIPTDFSSGQWMVSGRCEGTLGHCIIKNNRAIIRGKSGRVLRWGNISGFPNGTSIFYGIFDHGIFYIYDLLLWNGLSLCEVEMDNRLEFGRARLDESGALRLQQIPFLPKPAVVHRNRKHDTHGIQFISRLDSWKIATKETFLQLYDACSTRISGEESQDDVASSLLPPNTLPDGLWFYHRSSYHLPGLSPFLLHFKDKHTCRWPIDTRSEALPDGTYPPAESLRVRLWLSRKSTAVPSPEEDDSPNELGENRRETILDTAYTAEGFPALRQHGLFREYLGDEEAGVIVVEIGDRIALTQGDEISVELTDANVIGTTRTGPGVEHAFCQSSDCDSLSKIVYLSHARLDHFGNNEDHSVLAEHLYQALADDSIN